MGIVRHATGHATSSSFSYPPPLHLGHTELLFIGRPFGPRAPPLHWRQGTFILPLRLGGGSAYPITWSRNSRAWCTSMCAVRSLHVSARFVQNTWVIMSSHRSHLGALYMVLADKLRPRRLLVLGWGARGPRIVGGHVVLKITYGPKLGNLISAGFFPHSTLHSKQWTTSHFAQYCRVETPSGMVRWPHSGGGAGWSCLPAIIDTPPVQV